MAKRSQSTAPPTRMRQPRTPVPLLLMPMLLSLPLMLMLRVTLLRRLPNPSRLTLIHTKPMSTMKAATSVDPPRTTSSTTTAPGGRPPSSSRLLYIPTFLSKTSLLSVSSQDVSPLVLKNLTTGTTAEIPSYSRSSQASPRPLKPKKGTP